MNTTDCLCTPEYKCVRHTKENRPFILRASHSRRFAPSYMNADGVFTERQEQAVGFKKRWDAYSFAHARGHESGDYNAVRAQGRIAGIATVATDTHGQPTGEIVELTGPVYCEHAVRGTYRVL